MRLRPRSLLGRRLFPLVAGALFWYGLYFVLLEYAIRVDVVSRIFALGPHVSLAEQAAAAGFAATRILVALLLPGLLAMRVIWILWDACARRATVSAEPRIQS